jgi:cobalamin biosynthesis protein CobT
LSIGEDLEDANEEEEDEDNEENEDEEEEDGDEEDEDEDEDGEEEEEDEEEEGEEDEEEEEEKKPEPPKLSKFQSIMNALRDINLDLDNVDRDVDRVYTKVNTARPKYRDEPKPPRRNYHDAMDREDLRRSFSPRRNGSNRRDDYDSDYQRR